MIKKEFLLGRVNGNLIELKHIVSGNESPPIGYDNDVINSDAKTSFVL